MSTTLYCSNCNIIVMEVINETIGVVFTRLGGISRLAFVYRCQDGSIKKIPAGIGRKK